MQAGSDEILLIKLSQRQVYLIFSSKTHAIQSFFKLHKNLDKKLLKNHKSKHNYSK